MDSPQAIGDGTPSGRPGRDAARVGPDGTVRFRPIGRVRSPYANRIDAPHQPTVVAGTETGREAEAWLDLDEDLPLETLRDLEGFQRIWVVFAFHRSDGWKPLVRPPRGRAKRGVFATRSPHRPNAIGLSCVELVAVAGRRLTLRGVDLLDGTPVLDIKPYVPYADAFPGARAGWIDQVDAETGRHSAPGPRRPRRQPRPAEPSEPQQPPDPGTRAGKT